MKRKSYIDDQGDARELDEQFFREAKRGRPPLPAGERKQRTNIMLDPDLLDALKATGPGWQTRVNAMLRKDMGLDAA